MVAKLVEGKIVHQVEGIVFKHNREAVGDHHGVVDEVLGVWIPLNLLPWAQANVRRIDRVRAGKAEGEAQVVANNKRRKDLASDTVGTRGVDVLHPVRVGEFREAHGTVA